MMIDKRLTMSKRDLARIQVVEFGKILFNLQIVMALIFASPLPFVAYPLYYLVLILLGLFTGFIIFLNPHYVSLWNPVEIYKVTTYLVESWKYSVPMVICISLLSILFLCFDKNNKHKKRIIASIVIIVLVLLYLILRVSIIKNGGAE